MSDRKYKMVLPVLVSNKDTDLLTEEKIIGKTVLGTNIKTDNGKSMPIGYITRAYRDSRDSIVAIVEIQLNNFEYCFSQRLCGLFKEHDFLQEGTTYKQFVLDVDFKTMRFIDKLINTVSKNTHKILIPDSN